jgi:hypothetical protein
MFSTIFSRVTGLSFFTPSTIRVLSSSTTELSTVTRAPEEVMKRTCSSGCICATTGVEPTTDGSSSTVAASTSS